MTPLVLPLAFPLNVTIMTDLPPGLRQVTIEGDSPFRRALEYIGHLHLPPPQLGLVRREIHDSSLAGFFAPGRGEWDSLRKCYENPGTKVVHHLVVNPDSSVDVTTTVTVPGVMARWTVAIVIRAAVPPRGVITGTYTISS